MFFDYIAEINSLYNFAHLRTAVFKKSEADDSFYVVVFDSGGYSVYVYELRINRVIEITTLGKDDQFPDDSDQSYMDLDEPDRERHCEQSNITLSASFRFQFPVYFITNISGKITAFGKDENTQVVLNEFLTEPSHSCDWNLSVSAIDIPNASNLTMKLNPIICAVVYMDSLLIVCRSDVHCLHWSVEMLHPDQRDFQLATVSFPNQNFINCFSKTELGPTDTYSALLEPCLLCVKTSKIGELGQNETLTRNSFVKFFGEETLCLTNSVILFGIPDGRVVWCPLPPNYASSSSRPEIKFSFLCDLEQPVRGMHVFSHDGETPGDSLLIIGALGKLLILFSTSENENSFECLISYIPSPVYVYIMKKNWIYHTSLNGQLWVSKWKSSDPKQQPTQWKFVSQMMDMTEIKAMNTVIEHEGLTLCFTQDGCIYLGRLSSEKDDKVFYSEKVPFILDACYEQSSHLQILESEKLKQTTLFSQLATLTSVLEGILFLFSTIPFHFFYVVDLFVNYSR